ncbi:MAG: IscA/HesB family protein [Thermodesulfobacteriota bacterium]
MVELTPEAKTQLDRHFEGQDNLPSIRVYMASGCSGPGLALGLDEKQETDDLFDVQGYSFVVDKSLVIAASPITIDAAQYGFSVSSNLETTAGGGSGCGGCSGCG